MFHTCGACFSLFVKVPQNNCDTLALKMTRRTILSGLATAAGARPKTWKPKLGILGNFSEDNIDFAVKEGFTSIGLWAHRRTILDAGNITSQTIDLVKSAVSRSGLRLSVIATTE